MCHVNPSGGGALIAVLENDGQAVNGGFCSECHNASLSMPNIGPFHGVSNADTELQNRHNNLAVSDGIGVTFTNAKIIQRINE